MPNRHPFRYAGWLRPCFALALSLASATATVACPLCYQAARQMMTEGVQLDMADRAVLAARDGAGGALRVVAVVKGSDEAGNIVSDPVSEGNGAAAGEPALLVRDPTAAQWANLGAIPVEDADWLRKLAATRDIPGDRPKRAWPLTPATADALSYEGWRQRVALILPYLENANPLAARLASGELARAPYAALIAARSKIDPVTVEAWIDDPKLASRRAAYLTLLGFVGGRLDAARLDQRIEAALTAHDAADLAAMIAADLELGGPPRLEWIVATLFADRKRTMPEIEAALLALNVLGDADGAVPRPRVAEAYRTFIRERPAMAGFVAPQLADWGSWDAAPEFSAILKTDPAMDPSLQFAIMSYLKRAANAGAAIQ